MTFSIIDAHIHLDHYEEKQLTELMRNVTSVEALISVSFNLVSSQKNKTMAQRFQKVKPAYGFHPEQDLPSESELSELLSWMELEKVNMVAIGEVGLPYYRRLEGNVTASEYGQYIELLEEFIKRASQWSKPIALHAVYDDAPIVCDLLEKHSVKNAHFHWFKGDDATLGRMAENGYHISITPDVLYEEEIQKIVSMFPLSQTMVETDGPWPFEGPFEGKMTNPLMMKESLYEISRIHRIPLEEVALTVLETTKRFYRL
ncbi:MULTISPECIES: TatD family hydrolase [unclassified Bacillus (in: firmicutes)]|uniref:TatD family hydrolase n=1 Tax=unclassified Bacillus (in: firmicutes) TaxID=185979 RepID=UPI0008EBB10E|nr:MULTISPECIES: TatD family hydrolase [unclassified Bacillus (in: firmicutes)]SFA70480.1 TatD DNase family protein [Bacillus sp. UNCCL13]SFQ60311.1 TatD DNase family protein [Bacillus sp. cl95]